MNSNKLQRPLFNLDYFITASVTMIFDQKATQVNLSEEYFQLYGYYSLLDDYLLGLHVVAVDQAQHIYARRSIDSLANTAVHGIVAEDAAVGINYLQDSLTLVADDPVAVAKEGEGPIIIVCVPTNEHQLETALIVRRLGLEAVARVDKQVNVIPRFEIESRDGRATASRTFIRLIEQVYKVAARTRVQVVVDDHPTLILILGFVTISLALIARDNHHIGDEGLRPNALCKGEESDK